MPLDLIWSQMVRRARWWFVVDAWGVRVQWPSRDHPRARGVSFPGGASVAVWPVVNVEVFARGKAGPALQPHLARGHDIANGGWRDYGCRAGVWRLLEVAAELSLPVTAALNAQACVEWPEVVEAIVGQGWEVMAHGLDNTTSQYEMDEPSERAYVARTVGLLQERCGRAVRGWLTPGFDVSSRTHELLCEAGLAYTADWGCDDRPAWLRLRPGRLLAIPYSLETNDISLFLGMHYTPPQFTAAIVDHVAQLSTEPAGSVAAIGLHPFLAGQPGRIPHLRECLQKVRDLPGVWLATGGQIYDFMTQPASV